MMDLEKYLFFSVKTLRDTLTFNYPIYSDYKKVLPYTDLPYTFNQRKKPWWRWYYYASGTYFSRLHVNHTIWYNNHFKKKIGIYMPIVFKMPHKREKRYRPWIKKYFVYENSYKKKIINWVNPKNSLSLAYGFFNYNYYKSNLITNYAHWKYHTNLRSYKSSFYVGSENEMFISGYNYKWNNLYLRDSLFNDFLINFNYTMPVNYFSMYGSFFINSYDSDIVLHPHSFFNYYEKLNKNRVQLIKNILIYTNKDSFNNLYLNIINYYNKIYFNNIKSNLDIYYNKIKKNLLNKTIMFFLFKNKIKKKNLILKFLNIKSYSFINKFTQKKKDLFINYMKNIENYIIKIYNTSKLKNLFLYRLIKVGLYKKIKFLFMKSGLIINKVDFLYNKKNITQTLIKLIKLLKKRKKERYFNFLKNIKKYFYKNKKYRKIFLLKKENLIYKLKIRRFNTYPKIFIKMIEKYRYLSHRITVVRNKALNNNVFSWSKFLKNYMLYTENFLYNFFYIFIDLYKMNFGYLYNLNTFNKENVDYIDFGFFLEIQIFIYKFFNLFKKKYLNKFFLNFINKNYLKYNIFLGKISKNNKLKKTKEINYKQIDER